MKVLFICSSDQLALPTLTTLSSKGYLAAIVVPEQYSKHLSVLFIQRGIPPSIIHTITKSNLQEKLTVLIESHQIETALVLTFPWKLPEPVLSLPKYGFINLHGGILPKYKGADPIFWQMKNSEANGGITAHKMTSEIDEGPILAITPLPIIPGETYGMHAERLSMLASETAILVLNKLQENEHTYIPTNDVAPSYFPKPAANDLVIDWKNQTAQQIEALVNACNPRYKGALTSIKQIRLAILEVSPADINNVPADVLPGTIVYSDAVYGLIVACLDSQFLRIGVVQATIGYLSGNKLFQLGFKVGDKFE